LKAFLFLTVLIISAFLILIESFSWKKLGLLCLAIWSATRLYYFMFYVIEKYVDPAFKFSGVLSFIAYVFKKGKSH
ncbi:MAG: hypothetical protein ACYS8Z_06525, partial [Planctomycetota bacterium]